jgi:Putative zinc-finger
MQKIPQIVRERLKAGAAISGHPDANALTAFAESSLPERERAGVLAHLAACGDCREIVALALPAIETGNTQSFALRVPWLAWPAFRWGFATAGVALLAIGVVEFEQRKLAPPGMLAKQVASTPVPHPLPVQTSSQATSSVPPATASEAISDKSLGKSMVSAKMVSAKKEARRAAEGEPRLLGKPMSPQPQSALVVQAGSPALVAKPAPAPIPPASQMVTVPVQNEAAEVQSADSQAARLQIPSNAEPVFDSNSGYNSAPLTRAKPANIAPLASGTAAAVLATSRWSITAVGGLERSLDRGKTWQDVNVDVNTALAGAGAATVGPTIKGTVKQNSMSTQPVLKAAVTPVFFRAVTAAGSEVWAGGSHAALFHSVDGGDHWTRILPSSSGVVLTGDVVSIEFPDLLHGTVTTSTPEIWMTVDDGRSWQKQ